MKQLYLLAFLFFGWTAQLVGQCYCEDCPANIAFGSPASVSLTVSGITNNQLGQNGQSLVNVGVHFTHDAAQELSMRLVAPNGTFVDLTIGEGLGFGQFNYFDIDFVQCSGVADPDCSNNSTWTSLDYWNGGPYTGSYFPESGCLENLSGDVNGTWTIELDDVYLFEDGELYCFDLTFADAAGVSCNSSGCGEPICLAQGGLTMEPYIITAPEGDPSLLIDYTLTYDFCEVPNSTPEYIYIYVIFSSIGGNIIEIQQGTVDLTTYVEGTYVVQGYSILAVDLPIVEGLDFATSTITNIDDLIVSGTICADFTPNAGLVFIENCTIDFTASLEFDQITAEAGDPSLDPDWEITWTPAAPDPSVWGVYYVVYDQVTGVIITYLAIDDFTWASAGDYNVSVLVYNLNDATAIPPPDGISTYNDLLDAILNEELCGLVFGNNQLFITEPCTIDANGTLEQENITAPQASELFFADWDITFTGAPPDPNLYGFYYVVVNADTDEILAYYTDSNFTPLLEGNYYVTIVYYLLDDEGALPLANNGNTFLDLINLINNNELCAQYFGYNLLFVLPACEADAGTFIDSSVEGCVGSDDLLLDLTPQYPGGGPDESIYGYTYVVSENGVIIDISMSQDFTGYVAGNYEICGLSYFLADENDLPLPDGNITTSDILADIDNEVYCANLTTDCISLTITEAPMPIFTGPEVVCAGEDVQYMVENFTGNNSDYLFIINQGSFFQFINDEMGTLDVTWAAGPGNICVVQFLNGCETEVCLSIEVLPQPDILIDGIVLACPDELYTYTFSPTPTGNQSYDVSITGGVIIDQNDNSVLVDWSDLTNAVLTVTLLDEPCNSLPVEYQVIPAPQVDFPSVAIPPTSCFDTGLTISDISDPNISDWTWSAANADIQIANGLVNFDWQMIGPTEICLEADLGCGVEQMCYNIDVLESPEPSIAAELEFCSLTFTLAATPDFGNSWLWTSPGSGSSVSFANQTNFSTEVTVTQAGTYTFVLQESSNECIGTAETTVTITDGLIIGTPSFTCDNTGNYTVSFEINSGTPPYSVDGVTISGNFYTSPGINSGETFSFLISDAEGCNTTIVGDYFCPCISDAGSMSSIPINICISSGDEGLAIHNGDATLDGNDLGVFILHTGSSNVLGNIIGINDTGAFSFDPNTMVGGQVYYISYTVGNEILGNIDLLDPCLSVSEGQPIIFYDDPIIDAGSDISTCALISNLSSNAITQGGTWSTQSQPPGSNVNFQFISGETLVEVDVEGTYTFLLTAVENGCPGSDEVIVTFLENPTSIDLSTECEGETYVVTFTMEGGTAPYSVNGEVINGNQYTSLPIPSGDVFTFTIEDALGCTSEVIQGIEVCNCITDAGTMSTEEIEICAVEGEIITSTFNNDATFDSDDAGVFVLHTNSTNILGQILASNENGEFSYTSAFGSDLTLYISYVVATEVGGGIDVTDECLSVSVGQPVTIRSLVKVDAGIYENECSNFINLSADDMGFAGEWNVVNAPVGANVIFDNQSNAQTNFETDLPGVYSLVWMPLNTNCTVADTTTFELFPQLALETLVVACAEDLNDYTINVEMSGGVEPYFLDGTEVAANFTSPSIISGQPYNFIVSDSRGCELNIAGSTTCSCSNMPGSMMMDTLKGCTTDTLVGVYNQDAVLDDNDRELFVLHTSPADSLGAVFYISNEPEVFFLPGMIAGNVYYLSHMIGNDTGTGIDYNDPCLRISVGQPVIFNAPPTVNAGQDQQVCGLSAILDASSSEPNAIWSVIQTPFGSDVTLDEDDMSSTILVTQRGEYILGLEADNGFCKAYDTVAITFIESISYQDLNIQCTADGYTVGFTIIGGVSPYFVDGVVIPGSGFESDLILLNEPYNFTVEDSGNCVALEINGFDTCACENDAGTMSNALQILCIEEVIDLSALDNNDVILEADDIRYYVIHTSPSGELGDVLGYLIYSNSIQELSFTDFAFEIGETYYISTVLANGGVLDGIEEDPCIKVAIGTPIIWEGFDRVSFNEDLDVCPGENIIIEITASGVFPFEVLISDGLGFEEIVVIDQQIFELEYLVSESATLIMMPLANTECLNIEKEDLVLTVEILPTAEVRASVTICNNANFGSSVTLDELITSGDDSGVWFFEGNEVAEFLDFDGFEAGEYMAEYVIESALCATSNAYVVQVLVEDCDCPSFDYSYQDVSCFGKDDGTITILTASGVNLEDYTILLNDDEMARAPEISDLSPGAYVLEITDGNNCMATFEIAITEPAPVLISLGEDMEAEINDPVVIEAITNLLDQEIDEITWTSLEGILDDNDLLLNTSFAKDDMISIRITDENGCEGSDDIMVRVTYSDYSLPNVINTNSTSGNEVFKIFNTDGIDEIIGFSIYDRWGNRMYNVENVVPDDASAQWDGSFGGRKVTPGVYIYHIILLVRGEQEVVFGDLTVM